MTDIPTFDTPSGAAEHRDFMRETQPQSRWFVDFDQKSGFFVNYTDSYAEEKKFERSPVEIEFGIF